MSRAFARLAVALAAGFVLHSALVARSRSPTPEPAYRDYGRALVHYATVQRPNGVTRRLFVDPSVLPMLRRGLLPDRALIAMEVFEGADAPARVEMKRWKEGTWLYGTHAPADPLWTTGPDKVCESCHARAGDRFEVFTFESLTRFAREGRIDRFACDAKDREPCEDQVYRRR